MGEFRSLAYSTTGSELQMLAPEARNPLERRMAQELLCRLHSSQLPPCSESSPVAGSSCDGLSSDTNSSSFSSAHRMTPCASLGTMCKKPEV